MKDNWDHITGCWYERQLRPLVGERQLRPHFYLLLWKTIETIIDNWDHIIRWQLVLVGKTIETTFLLVGMKDNWDHIISCWYERQLRPHFYLLVWKTIETTLLVVGVERQLRPHFNCWYERQLKPHYWLWKTIETTFLLKDNWDTLLVVGMKDNWDHISTCWYERQLRPHY